MGNVLIKFSMRFISRKNVAMFSPRIFLFAICAIYRVSAHADIPSFFPQINDKLTDITWFGSFQTVTQIQQIIESSDIMMLKIKLVTRTDGEKPQCLIKLPDVAKSEMTLEAFLDKVKKFNAKSKEGYGKGVKITFDDKDALGNCFESIKSADAETYPILVEANVLQGPGGSTNDLIEPATFLDKVKDLPNAFISLGWTTNNDTQNQYTDQNVKDMIDILSKYSLANVTFSVRASLAAHSNDQLKNLINNDFSRTITIFSDQDDTVDKDSLQTVILSLKLDKVFLDVPDDLRQELKLDDTGSGFLVRASTCIVLIAFLTLRSIH